MTKRIYFMGAQSTGKTTLASWLSGELMLPLLPEVARGVARQMKKSIEEIRKSEELVNEFQERIFLTQCEQESFLQDIGFVSDRGLDNLAYAAEHTNALHDILRRNTEIFREAVHRLANSTVFFIRPEKAVLTDDGERPDADLEWESVVRIDSMIKFTLQYFGIEYHEITWLDLDARKKFVLRRVK